MIFFGLDLKHLPTICDPARNSLVGGSHEPGQIGVCANHAAFAVDDVSPLRGALWRRAQGQEFFLPRPLSVPGFCSTDLSRKLARHRSVSARASGQAVPHGHQEPGVAQYSGRCQREAGLAALRRLCPVAHRHRPSSLCRGLVWRRPQRHGLRFGCQHHRSVPVGICLGSVSLDQGGHQVAHAVGSARQHPFVSPRQRWQTARRQRSGPAVARAGCFLHHGPRIHRLPTALSVARGEKLLCHPRQIQPQSPTSLFASGRSKHGVDSIRLSCSPASTRAKTSTHPFVASDSKSPTPASGWCFSPTISSCRRSPSPSFIVAGGKSSCFSNGSSSIFVSKSSSAPPRTPSKPKSGLHSRSTCSSPSSRSDSTYRRACMKYYRS